VRKLGKIAFAFYCAIEDPRPFHEQRLLAYDDESGHDRILRFVRTLVTPERIILRSNSTEVLLESARTGVGCAMLPCFVAEGQRDLRRLPTELAMPPQELWLAYHEDLRQSPRLRAVVDFIEQVVRQQAGALCPPDLFPDH